MPRLVIGVWVAGAVGCLRLVGPEISKKKLTQKHTPSVGYKGHRKILFETGVRSNS